MTDRKATFETLDQLLKQDETSLAQLADILDQEHAALANNDMEALEKASSEKDELLGALRERAREKIHALAQLGYRPDSGKAASEFLMEQVGAASPLVERWQSAREKLSECQHRNAVNGRILSHLQRRLGRISSIIRGADQKQSLYGSAGESHSLTNSQVFASA